ncbi:MAG: DUF1697 domain-containing protein [Bacteroidia bacterium]|nr:DUF1697 domain-containing protein [Bacteroidia bacterium]
MHTYIVFLRGINVSGQKKIRMAELRSVLSNAGFHSVETYIQSGNLIVRSKASEQEVSKQIHKLILDTFGFDVPVLTLVYSSLQDIIENNPYPASEENNKGIYFVMLFDAPDNALSALLQNKKFTNEEFTITPSCIYLNCHEGYGRAKCNNNFFEGRLKIQATARNWKTMKRMEQLASEMTE